jgi:hexosaminidase
MKRLLSTFAILTILTSCNPKTGQPKLKVSWNLESNYERFDRHRATWTLTNTSNINLTNKNWALYWNMIQRDIVPDAIDGPVKIQWVQGDFFEMTPTKEFQLAPGQEMKITYLGKEGMIKYSDAPTGLYMVFKKANTEELIPIDDFTIHPFEGEKQINRSPTDEEPIPTAEWLYGQNSIISEMHQNDLMPILPSPKVLERTLDHFVLSGSTEIVFDPELENEADFLSASLDSLLSGTKEQLPSNQINLQYSNLGDESYQLAIFENQIMVQGSRKGVFYGIQSLLGILPISSWQKKQGAIQVPTMNIEDEPAFAYRGMHIDLARNYNSPATVKRLIDIMALYKLNTLQIRLTEDEAWRIEIEELPELTEIGGYRGHTLTNKQFLQPSYGSGPFSDPDKGHGSGFLTREEYIDLVRYAGTRHIELIPEVCMPSHARAAIKAMEYRYHRFTEGGNTEAAEEFRLIDPDDSSKYRSAQWYTDNSICVCRESALHFFKTVVEDFVEMHEEAGFPLQTFHTGGDEVANGAWTGSPMCKDFLEENREINNIKNLQPYFFRQMNDYLWNKGLKTGGWEEVAMRYNADGSWQPNPEFTDKEVIPYIWNSLWGDEDLGNRLANSGYPVVLCNVTNFYFDLAYNKDPREPGLYWAGFVDTRDAFDFVPYDVFKSIKKTNWGKSYSSKDFEGKERLNPEAYGNILGIQGQLWSETIKGRDMLEYYYLPKLFGLAERAWAGQASWGDLDSLERIRKSDADWNQFANRIGQRELQRLNYFGGGYNYRLAPPGVKSENGKVTINASYPGFEMRYSLEGDEPTIESPLYTGPFHTTAKQIKVSTFDAKGRASFSTSHTIN